MSIPDRNTIPVELQERNQWVTWRHERGTKVPYNARTGHHAKSTDPDTWSSCEVALRAAVSRRHDGVGFVFSDDDPYVGIDLDDCIADALIAPWAQQIIEDLDSYAEVSPSGTGIKIFARGAVAASVKTAHIEIYDHARYFTVTGQRLDGAPSDIRVVNGAIDALWTALQPVKDPLVSPAPTTRPPGRRYLEEWAARKIAFAVERVALAADGTKHNTRLDMARLLGGLVPLSLATEEQIESALYGANLPSTEAQRSERKTIRDGIRIGIATPLTLPDPPEQPVFDAKGCACCPKHQRVLTLTRKGTGYTCHAKDASGARGWCEYWWDGDGYVPPASAVTTIQTVVSTTEAQLAKPAELPLLMVPINGNVLMTTDYEPPRVIIPNLLRAGLSFFIGQPGIGKTPALSQLAGAYAIGGKWLSAFDIPKCHVAYIGPEYSAGEIRETMDRSFGRGINWDHLHVFCIDNFSPPRDEEEAMSILEHLANTYGIQACIIDLLTGYLPPEKFKQNAYRGDYKEFLAYHRLMLHRQIALTGAWHGTKRDANPATMYNGGQGFWGSAGGGRMVMYQDEDDQVKLYSQLRGNKAVTYTLAESHMGGKHFWSVLDLGDEAEPSFASAIHRAIWRVIRDEATPTSPLRPSALASILRDRYPEVDANRNYVRKSLGILLRRGVLRTHGDGYLLADQVDQRDQRDQVDQRDQRDQRDQIIQDRTLSDPEDQVGIRGGSGHSAHSSAVDDEPDPLILNFLDPTDQQRGSGQMRPRRASDYMPGED